MSLERTDQEIMDRNGPEVDARRNGVRVMKFGGTSVQDAEAMHRVVRIVRDSWAENRLPRLVVTSACAGITNLLVECADCCSVGDYRRAYEIVETVADRHREILESMFVDGAPSPDPQFRADMEAEVLRLRRLVEGSELLQETTPRTVDAILATGELLSTHLLTAAFVQTGVQAKRLRSDEVLATDEHHGSARPDMERTRSLADAVIRPVLEETPIVILQGFIGGTEDGVITTLGRGGSDFSAALLGRALDAEAIEIWTDVDGILTADPRIVPAARPIDRISFSGARELAWYGAKVIHPDTILPAVEGGVPVIIRNSHNPASGGTTILPDAEEIPPGIYSLTGRRDLLILEITSSPAASSGTLGKGEDTSRPVDILALFAANSVPVLLSVIAESTLSVVIPGSAWKEPFRTILESAADVRLRPDAGLLCLGGSCVRTTPALLAEPLAALREVPIRLLAAGSSDHSILLALDEERLDDSLRLLHELLFEAR